jgi:hypothetical protein
VSDLTERLRLKWTKGSETAILRYEAADRIDELEAALREIRVLRCGRQIACAQSNGKDVCCNCIARQALGDDDE